MARTKNRRDANVISNQRLPILSPFPERKPLDFTPIADERRWHPIKKETPAAVQPPRSPIQNRSISKRSRNVNNKQTVLSLQDSYLLNGGPAVALFQPSPRPRKDVTCARRTIRKQVIIARGLGRKGQKKPRFTAKSKVKC